MNEAPIPDIHAHMVNKQPWAHREEHQVAGLKLAAVQRQARLALQNAVRGSPMPKSAWT